MKIKNSEIVDFINGIHDIQKKRLPIKLGYAITKNIKSVESSTVAYEEERKKILDRYTVKNEKGEVSVKDKRYVFTDEPAYEKDIKELLDIVTEVEVHTVNFEELEKCDSEQFDSLSVQDITILEFMTNIE